MYLLGINSLRVIRFEIILMDSGFIGRIPNNIVVSNVFSKLKAIKRVL